MEDLAAVKHNEGRILQHVLRDELSLNLGEGVTVVQVLPKPCRSISWVPLGNKFVPIGTCWLAVIVLYLVSARSKTCRKVRFAILKRLLGMSLE